MNRKNQKPLIKQKWNKRIVFYHNKGSKHFFLSIGKRGVYVMGFDMTTHPSLTKKHRVKKKYIALVINPSPHDRRISYIDKKLRINIKIHFEDTHKKR